MMRTVVHNCPRILWETLCWKLAVAGAILIVLLFGGTSTAYAGQEQQPGHYPSNDGGDGNPYNGYLWHDDNWVPGLITIDTWFTPTPTYASGRAVFYGPNVMEGTARWRGMGLSDYVDGVALMSPADIGSTVWLRRPGHDWEGPYLVVDSAARHDMYPVVLHRNEIVEVGFETALRWGMVYRTGGGWATKTWAVEGVEVLKAETLPPWVRAQEAHRGISYVKGILEGIFAVPIYYPTWFEEQVSFSTEWEPHPYYVRPAQWDMRDGSEPMRWFDFPITPPLFVSQPDEG